MAENKKPLTLTRRDFLKVIGGVAALGVSFAILSPSPSFPRVLPPGALLPADRFRAACNGCGKCVAVCPHNALRADIFGQPYIDGLSGWCDLCMDCVEVCPTGALVLPADPLKTKLALAEIDRNQCIAWVATGCRFCYEKCTTLQQAITIDEDYRPYITESACNGCGACVNVCPRPDKVSRNLHTGRAVALKEIPHGA